MLIFTSSRTALITPPIALLCFAIVAIGSKVMVRHRSLTFGAGVAIILLGAGALIGYGLMRGNLIHDSLTFRWRYWIGSTRLFLQHPILGVGWNNFGDPYLAVREAIASEEIKDPHNLFVRFATELGGVGLLLVVGWLGSLWWEITRPQTAATTPETRSKPSAAPNTVLARLAWIATAGIAINIIFSVDLAQDISWVFIEVLKRMLYLALILIGLIVVTFRSFVRQEIDDRPAPWLRCAIMIALGMFLLHNLIDFSFFETGPMWIFMLLAGAAIGIATPTPGHRVRAPARIDSPLAFIIMTSLTLLIWLLAGVSIALPITLAESQAHTADELLRAKKPAPAARC